MGKTVKILGALVLFVIIVSAGLVAFVHYYLTEERVKALVIPQAESALGRDVAIGDIKIGLLTGITIKNFLIKEADRQSDFVSTKAFVLNYDLMPLLQKKLVISEIRFDEPTVQIIRDKRGQFNFSSLAVLTDGGQKKVAKEKSTARAALPLALTFDQINLNRAHIIIRDQLQELPDVDATTSAKLNVALGRTLKDLQYDGNFTVKAAVKHGAAKVNISGKGNMNQKDLDVVLDQDLDGEKIHIEAEVKNYLQAPIATLTVNSKSLNIDKLLAMVAGMPQTTSGKSGAPLPDRETSSKVIADSLPPGLVADGTVNVDKALYKGISTSDFALLFNINKGVLTVQELSAKAYSGKVDSNMTVDLNKPGMAYDGSVNLQSVQAADFSSALVQKAAGMLTGSLQSAISFSGAGTTWSEIINVLNADGSFTLLDGGIKGTPVSSSISTLLGLQELNNISYKNITGTFKIVEGGKVRVKSSMQGENLDAVADGIIGLDGTLDLPLTLHLSPPLADKLKSRASFAKYLTDEQGGSTLHLKLKGSLSSPRPTLDMSSAKSQIQKSIQNKLFQKLEGSDQETETKESPENLIKGLFGR
ncbi:AsmA family protein [Thermodesulfobacteriota bacterium]